MRNFNMTSMMLPILSLSTMLLAQPARADKIDLCSYAAEQCVKWYKDKIEEDNDFTPDQAYNSCPVTGAQSGWRNSCSAESQVRLKAQLKDVQAAHTDAELEAAADFVAKVTYKSYADCKGKWDKQLAIHDTKATFASLKTNESSEKVCKVIYPFGENTLRECPILDCPDPGKDCKWENQPVGADKCPISCGTKSCVKQFQ